MSAETIDQSLYAQSRGAGRELTKCLRTGRALQYTLGLYSRGGEVDKRCMNKPDDAERRYPQIA